MMIKTTHTVRRMVKAWSNYEDLTHGYIMVEIGPNGKKQVYVNASYTKIRATEHNILEKVCIKTGETELIGMDEFKWIAQRWEKQNNPQPPKTIIRRKK